MNTTLIYNLVYILIVKLVTGVTLTGSSPYSVLNQFFQFTCTQTGSIASNFLPFKRGTSSICTIVYPGDASQCTQFTAVSGYSCYCGGSGVFYMNISSVSLQDEDRWNCVVNTQSSNNITLPVYFGPPGVNITGNQQTDAPDVLTLTCTTTGRVNPAPTLTWRNSTDGAVLSGTSPVRVGSSQDGGYVYRSTLSITTQWYQDGDTIVCEGRNPGIQSQQTVIDSEQLDINYPPQSAPVISGLSSSPVYEGDSVSVTCRVTGGKPLVTTVTLTCPGGHQSSSTTTEGSDTRLTTLTFSVTRDLRSQPCLCSAVHSTGRYQLSANRTKNNIYYPPTIQNLSQSFPWLEGRTESLTCDLSDPGHPSATYIWYRDDVRQTQQTGHSLQFSPLSYTDNRRQIYCQAENQFTVDKSRVVKSSVLTLDVYYSPRVSTTPSSSVTKIEGDSLTVDCTADSNPTPTGYHWTHQSVTRSNEHQLSIPDLDRTDHGEYRCTATTQAGSYGSLSGTATVQIVVNYSPDLTVTNVTETETQTATVKCLADGRPENFNFSPFLQTWRGQVIRHVTGQKTGQGREYQKVFSSSSFQDSGVYVCEVENGVPDRQGVRQHKANISVQINTPPKLTVGMESETVVGAELREKITLYRTIFSQTRITNHTWTKAGQTLTTSQVSDTPVELDIYGVRVEEMGLNLTFNVGQFNNSHDVGEYLLQVCNTVGCLTSVINLTAAGPPAPPTQFKIFITTQTSALLSWRAGFPGGPYTQVFVVEYRTPGGNWKEFTDSVSGIEGQLMVVEVTGLSAGTRYEFRVFARNTREVRNRSDYTDVLQEMTKVKPGAATEAKGITGPVVGAVMGVVIISLVVAGLIILYRKGYRCSITKTGKQNETPEVDRPYESVVPNTGQNMTYATLDGKEPQDYTELRLYENTKGKGNQETLTEPYGNPSLNTYENTKPKHNDPAYVNTRFT